MVFAQGQASSFAWNMPKAAIDTGCVDLGLPLHESAPVLVDIACAGTGLPRDPLETQASEALFVGGRGDGGVVARHRLV